MEDAAARRAGSDATLTRDKLAVVFDRRIPPVATVTPGERFVVETEDARGGLTRTPETTTPEYLLALRRRGFYGNPVTGPIYVEGAQPGDTLAVHIHEQECDTLGWSSAWPWLFHLEDFIDKPSRCCTRSATGTDLRRDDPHPRQADDRDDRHGAAVEADSLRRDGPSRRQPGCPGGLRRRPIYLPVNVPGALLALGDCHAIQSDGEMNEVEMRSVVTLSCDVLPGRSPAMSWPRIVTPDAGDRCGRGPVGAGAASRHARDDPVDRGARRDEQARLPAPRHRRPCAARPGADASVLDALSDAHVVSVRSRTVLTTSSRGGVYGFESAAA